MCMNPHYQPWEGLEYRSSSNSLGTRLLLLGEAHYGDPEADATVRYTGGYANGEFSHRFWTIAMQVVTGRPANMIDRRAFWDSVAFYNFIQEPAGDHARIRPTTEMWRRGRDPFFTVLGWLKPRHVLALGSDLWRYLPSDGFKGPRLVVGDEQRDTWVYPYDGGTAISTWVYHPSSSQGANSELSHPFLAALLRLDPDECARTGSGV